MRSNLQFIKSRVPFNLAESGTSFAMNWVSVMGGTWDPISRSVVGGTVTPHSTVLNGFIHSVNPVKSGVRRFAEVTDGDLIIDLAPDVLLPGGIAGYVLNEDTSLYHKWRALTNVDGELEYYLNGGVSALVAAAAPSAHPGWVQHDTTGYWHQWRALTNTDGVLEYFLDERPVVPEAIIEGKFGDFILNETTDLYHTWRAHNNSDGFLEYFLDATGIIPTTYFVVAGQRWVQKEIGDILATTWDVVAAGQKLYRTLLLTKQG